jgi:hypothetical protein
MWHHRGNWSVLLYCSNWNMYCLVLFEVIVFLLFFSGQESISHSFAISPIVFERCMDSTWCCVSQKARFQFSPAPWIYCSIANWYTNFDCFPIKCLGSSNLFFNQKNRKENWASKPKTYRVQLRITRNSKLLKRLDQGYLHPNLEGWRLTCPGQESNTGLHGGRWAL